MSGQALPPQSPVIELDVIDAGGKVVARYHLGEDGEYIVGRDRETAHILIDDKSVSRRHALVRRSGDTLHIADAGSLNGTFVGSGTRERAAALTDDNLDWIDWPANDRATVGVFTLRWLLLPVTIDVAPEDEPGSEAAIATTTLGADRDVPTGSVLAEPGPEPHREPPAFPVSVFGEMEIVSIAALKAAAEVQGVAVEERDYVSIGGGLGSLAWVDHLRIFGVASSAIRVIGVHAEPHGKWMDYCRNSQISGPERIRSNSASTPDNIWGFPGFALREAWAGLRHGHLEALAPVLKVFGEPLFAETYTPRLTQVTWAIERECRRIGWNEMFAFGCALALRKTDDGRYALAYRVPYDVAKADGAVDVGTRDRLCIARHMHVATGYPATRILPILQAFRRKHPDSDKVVNAYEPHDALYRQLEAVGGTVVVEGRGIVASRILQRLAQARSRNFAIKVVHVMRYPVTSGHSYDRARRGVGDNVEVQPFNWPKAAWGGTLRKRLEAADPMERSRLLEIWGGTTTADRRDWRTILAGSKREGWYRAVFGDLLRIRRVDGAFALTLRPPGSTAQTVTLTADYLIDCTGLVADITASPFLRDLLDVYAPPRNRAAGTGPERGMSGIRVSNAFEIRALRNGDGTVHASGVITANGPYAAVDSFLGLTYAALRSVEHLADLRAAGIRRMGPVRSFRQWLKWCRGVAP